MKNSNIQWIGAIPDSWQLNKIGQLFNLRNEKVSDKDFAPLSVSRGGVVPQMESVAKSDASDDRKLVLIGDFAINSRSDRKQSCGVSPLNGSVSLINLILYAKDSNVIYNDYMNYLLKNYGFAEEFYKWGHGIVADLWTTRWQEMKNIMLPLPSLEMQKKIFDFLNKKILEVNNLIEIENKQIEKLKEYKQAVITEAVTKGLDKSAPMKDSGVEWIGEIPEDWEVCRVKNIGFTQNGISKSGELFGNGYPFISYGDVYKHWVLPQTGSGLIESTEKDRKIFSVNKGDIFFTRTSETIEEVGFSSVCFETITNATFAGFLIRLRPYQPDSIIKSNYAKYYFRANLLRKYLVREMNIVTRASLSQELLGAMSVVLPPPNTQIEISLHLDSQCKKIDSLISIKQKKIDMLNEYKKSLIYEYVTGKKEVV